jgi:hypothetical protein
MDKTYIISEKSIGNYHAGLLSRIYFFISLKGGQIFTSRGNITCYSMSLALF